MMPGHYGQDGGQSTDPQWRMVGHGDGVLRWPLPLQSQVAAGLSRYLIIQARHRLDQGLRVEITRQFHAAITSSRT